MKASTLFEIKNRLMKLAFSIPAMRAPAIKAKLAEIIALIDEEVKADKPVEKQEVKADKPAVERKGRWAKQALTKEEK